MAFGDLLDLGFERTNGATVGDSTVVDNTSANPVSVSVAVGDLVYVVWAETTSSGVNGVTDNLGNTYTPLSAATDSGSIAARAFYARVTTAGTLDTITLDTTDTTNEGIAGVAVFEGPFKASPLDRNPTNVEDTTSPFSCPATGVMAQATELVVHWMASNDPGSQVLTDSPSNHIFDTHDGGSGPSYRLTMGYRVVAATTSVTPTFTENGAGNPGDSVLGTSTFMQDQGSNISPAAANRTLSGTAPTAASQGRLLEPSTRNLVFSANAPNLSTYTLVPDADVSDGTWQDQSGGTNLFAAIDDLSDDDYIRAGPTLVPGPGIDTAQVSLSNPASGLGGPVIVKYRYRKDGDGIVNLTVRLKQGVSEIASWTHTDISSTFATAAQTLTAPQLASITDVNDLRIEFESSAVAAVRAAQRELSSQPPTVAGGFSPAQFGSDLVAWYDATPGYVLDTSLREAVEGSLVGRWLDRSGNGYDVRQGEEGQHPTYRAASFWMNNRPALEFTPYVSNLRTKVGANGVKLGSGVTAVSMFAVINADPAFEFANDNRIISYRTAGDLNDYTSAGGFILVLNSYIDPLGVMRLSSYRRDDSLPSSGQHLLRVIDLGRPYRFGAIYVDASTRANYLNGSAQSEAGSSLGNFAASGEIGVGINPHMPGSSDAAQWGGWISEIIFVKRALTSNEISALDAYFASKWGFSS